MISTLLPALLWIGFPQDPTIQEPVTLDRIHLKVGATLSGVLEVVTDSYVQIRLDQGTVLGFDRGRILRLERNRQSMLVTPPSPIPPRDEWFVLHNTSGRAVGTLQTLVMAEEDGGLRLSESWRFVGEHEDTEITRIETFGRDLTPRTAFHHEKVRSTGHLRRVEKERLVRITFHDASMVVERLGDQGRSRSVLPFPNGACLPLLLAERLRHQQVEAGELLVYDPASDSFSLRNVCAPVDRIVPVARGRATEGMNVVEVSWTSGQQRHAEWLDATSRTVRREVNGEALVALPATADRAASVAEAGGEAAPSSYRVDLEAGFGLRLPNPIWSFGAQKIPNTLRADAPIYQASVQLERGERTADPAALGQAKLRLPHLTELERREDPSGVLVIEHCFLATLDPTSTPMRGALWIFRETEGPLLLHIQAPAQEWDGLANDRHRLVKGIERHRAALAPEGSAPLLDRMR